MKEFIDGLPSLPVIVGAGIAVLWFGGLHTWAALVLVIGFVLYVLECIIFPWTKCPTQMFLWGGCDATGKQWSPLSQTFRTCHKCGGTRKVVRLGRRLWTLSTDVNEDRK